MPEADAGGGALPDAAGVTPEPAGGASGAAADVVGAVCARAGDDKKAVASSAKAAGLTEKRRIDPPE